MKNILALAASLFFASALSAADLPAREGVIDQLPTKSDPRMVISDQIYNVAKDVVIRRSASITVPISMLRPGQKIRFTVVGEGPGVRGTVTEIQTVQ